MSDTRTANLLVELFVEELPPKALKKLGAAFRETMLAALQRLGLASAAAEAIGFASPRRLAVHIAGVAAQAPDRALGKGRAERCALRTGGVGDRGGERRHERGILIPGPTRSDVRENGRAQ